MNKNKYLNLEGLEKYDKLIKNYIDLSDKSLLDNVDSLTIDVDALKLIDHEAYISADITLEETLKKYTDNEVSKKQNIIEDLDEIRSGAAKGSSALQSVPTEYITEDELAEKEYVNTTQVEYLIGNYFITASNDEIDNLFND